VLWLFAPSPQDTFLKFLHPNVPILTVAQALMMSSNSLIVATAALVGYNLAEDKSLATLPLAVQFIAVMCTSIPAAMLMQKIGRKAAFLVACLFGFGGGLLTSIGIMQHEFWIFVAGTTLIGIFNGFGNYYRFTAADSVAVAYKSRAVSYIMLGGVVAAVAGPTLARHSREWLGSAEFAGSYMMLMVLYVASFIVLSFLKIEQQSSDSDDKEEPVRPLSEIIRQPDYMVALICAMFGYAIMSFVMTATPLAMDQAAFLFDDTSIVIQWHVMAMFAPSFFTGTLIVRFGVLRILFAGAVFGVLCVMINLMGTQMIHFLSALICLGLSWNFLFVGSTTLLSKTYRKSERNKAQALNDFIVFTTVAIGSLSSGALQNAYGWQAVNRGVIPFLFIIFLAVIWLHWHRKRQVN
jgi:predicted MFS family arabinose efflux permease